MAIPESQLETWSHQGAVQTSSTTYQTVRSALEADDTPFADMDYEVFLQGSYGNDTNVYAESDVDIVIKLNECYMTDLDALPEADKVAWHQARMEATYTHDDFKRDVFDVLVANFGRAVSRGNKAIAIAASGSRRKADVIPAIQYRRYYRFNGFDDESFEDGICFFDKGGNLIANYPKQHSVGMTTKHQDCNEWLKPTIRIMKNLRAHLVAQGILDDGVAPAYFLEGLLFNVPKNKFGKNYQACMVNAVNWLYEEADLDKLQCANSQFYLIREDTHNCWPKAGYEAFLNAAIDLWNNW